MIPEGWEDKNIGELIRFSGGSQPPKNTFIFAPFDGYIRLIQIRDYKTNEYATYVPKNLAKKFCNVDDVMIGRYGPPIFQILRGLSGAYNVALIKAIPSEKIAKEYMYYFLAQDCLQNFIEGLSQRSSGQTGIEMDQLKSYPLPLPPLPEQRKIAEILGAWDEAISTLEKLITAKRKLKQGLMQQLLTGKKRFKEFERSKWERYHFHEIFKRVTRKNTIGNSNILTISSNYGLINQRDFFNKRVAADNLDGYYLLEKGEFAYNKSYSNGYPLGAIKRLDRYEEGVLSTLYICFKIYNPLANGDFLSHYFESGIFNKELYGIAQEGARNHGLLNISVTDFFELLLRLPSLPEQEKIASVFSAADTEISTLEKQLAAYKQQKRGLMQQLLTGKTRVNVN